MQPTSAQVFLEQFGAVRSQLLYESSLQFGAGRNQLLYESS